MMARVLTECLAHIDPQARDHGIPQHLGQHLAEVLQMARQPELEWVLVSPIYASVVVAVVVAPISCRSSDMLKNTCVKQTKIGHVICVVHGMFMNVVVNFRFIYQFIRKGKRTYLEYFMNHF